MLFWIKINSVSNILDSGCGLILEKFDILSKTERKPDSPFPSFSFWFVVFMSHLDLR